MTELLDTLSTMYNSLDTVGKITLTAGALATAYFVPIVGLLLTCFSFTVVDMIYGIKVAKRRK